MYYVTICSVFVIYEIEMENKKTFFWSNWEFLFGIGKITYFLALGMGLNFRPKMG